MKFLNLFHLNIVVLFLLFSNPALCHSDDDDLFSLSLQELIQVEVYTASQAAETAAESAAIISVITSKQLKEWGVINLHDVMSFVPGIVTSETYLGQTTQTFRGVTPGLFNNKSLYLINGHPSYESLFGSALLDYIPIELVERIEVVRSPASVLYGTNAISGVINIITKQGEGNNSLATLRVGDNSHAYGSIVHHSKNLTMAASLQKDDGYNYAGTKDEFGNEVDLDYQYDFENLFIDSYGVDWRVNVSFFKREKALFGVNPWVWQNGVFDTHVGYLDANKKYKFNTAELNLWLRYDVSDKEIYSGEFPYPASLVDCRAYNIPTVPSDPCVLSNRQNRTDTSSVVINNVHRGTFEVQLKDEISEGFNYILGVNFEHQKSDPLLIKYVSDGEINRPAYSDDKKTHTVAAYSQVMYKQNDDTRYIIGLRGENNAESDNSGLLPRLGVTHQIVPDTYLKFLYSEAFRAPMFVEKSVNLQNVLLGDNNLNRETIKTFEIGLDSQINKKNQLQVAVYMLDLEDEILRFPSATSPATEYVNGAGKEMQGVEVEWRSILTDKFELILNASYVDGEDKSLNEVDAPLIANEIANAILTYRIASHWNVTFSSQYIGEKDVVSSLTNERSTLDSYQLFNFATVYKAKQHAMRLILNNLTDEEYSYPEPVRRKVTDVPGGAEFSAYAEYQYSF